MTGKNEQVGKEHTISVTPGQIEYANIINVGMITGIGLLMVTFFLYVSGILSPHVPVDQLPTLWGKTMKAKDFVAATHMPQGWSWLRPEFLFEGDILNNVGISLLGLLSVIGYTVALLPGFLRKKDSTYTIIVVLEIMVLLAAAMGMVKTGH